MPDADRAQLQAAFDQGIEWERQGNLKSAERMYWRLLNQTPLLPRVPYFYGMIRLLQDDYETAWPYYLRRTATEAYLRVLMEIKRPLWEGDDDPQKTVLIHFDQGIGDTVLAARFLPMVRERVGKVFFLVHAGMGRFFSSMSGDIEVLESGGTAPPFDEIAFALSLPAIFESSPETLPRPPYLHAEPELVTAWRARIDGDGLKVGIAWRGNSAQPQDSERSIALRDLAPILATEGVTIYSLQVDEGADEIHDLPDGLEVQPLDISGHADNMVDTAAVLANLDLVISVDSALAHTVGAMDLPVWVLLRSVPYWPYGMEGETTPWYPSARLFRASKRFDWAEPINRLAAEFKMLVSERAG